MQEIELARIVSIMESLTQSLKQAIKTPITQTPAQSRKGVKYTKSKGAVKQMNILLPLELAVRLKDEAAKRERTISDMTVTALVQYLYVDGVDSPGKN